VVVDHEDLVDQPGGLGHLPQHRHDVRHVRGLVARRQADRHRVLLVLLEAGQALGGEVLVVERAGHRGAHADTLSTRRHSARFRALRRRNGTTSSCDWNRHSGMEAARRWFGTITPRTRLPETTRNPR
jgi:hypothetical protein